jgi:hypothetical protein
MQAYPSTVPGTKISETFLEFARPLLEVEEGLPAQEEAEAILQIAFVIWNAVVLDTVNGNTRLADDVRSRAADGELLALFDRMIERKKTLYGSDLRLVGAYTVQVQGDQWHVRAQARTPAAQP